jgi:hypothetical protein
MPITPGAFEPSASSATSSGTLQPSSYHLNCGGITATDSAGLVWMDDSPFIISPFPFTTAPAASILGISAPMDSGDAAHQTIMQSRRYDFSSTLNAGAPGVLEYSLSLQGNMTYRLRILTAEYVAGAGVGDRVQTISWDYGAGTTQTFTSQLDIVDIAGAVDTFAVYEQQFTVTATGGQSARIMLAGGGVGSGTGDTSPLLSALEITGSARNIVVPLSPSLGKYRFKGQRIFAQQGLRLTASEGRIEFRGQTPDLATRRVRAPAVGGQLQFRGQAPSFSTGTAKSPSTGQSSFIGHVPDVHLLSPIDAGPSTGHLQFMGATVASELQAAVWSEQAQDDTNWVELPEDG